MTTLYARDESGFREAQPIDVLDRAHALLAQRYRTGSPVPDPGTSIARTTPTGETRQVWVVR